MLQEHVRGEASDDVSLEVVERLLALNALQEGVTGSQGNDWASYVAGSLRVGCNGYCMHAPLAEYDRRTAALLERVRGAADAAEGMTQADAVHVDFHHRNVLRSGDEVIAVVDWSIRFRGPADVTTGCALRMS